MADPYAIAMGWTLGWHDALGITHDPLYVHAFAIAWREYRLARKQQGESVIYIRTAWEQWNARGRIDG